MGGHVWQALPTQPSHAWQSASVPHFEQTIVPQPQWTDGSGWYQQPGGGDMHAPAPHGEQRPFAHTWSAGQSVSCAHLPPSQTSWPHAHGCIGSGTYLQPLGTGQLGGVPWQA